MMRSTALLLAGIFTTATPAMAQDMEGVEPHTEVDPQDFLDLLEDAGVELPGDQLLAPTIINGQAVSDDAWPSAGGLLANITFAAQGQQATFPMWMCSSTLIAPDVVLTAAHCVDQEYLEAQFAGLPVSIVDVQYAWSSKEDLSGYGLGGSSSLPPGAAVGSEWSQHNAWVGVYSLQVQLSVNHDIALVFLDEPVLDVTPALLPLPEEAAQIVTGAPITIVGWGNQEAVNPGQQPRAGMVGIRRAADTVIGEVAATEFQAGTTIETGRKCQGDSGGPTYMAMDTEALVATRVIGVTSHSWDETLCESKGGVDTRVDFYLDWIDAEMRAACEDGIRTSCDEPGILLPEFPIVEDEDDVKKACGCSAPATPASFAVLLGALGLVLARRRRR